ncbi:hypothetical protein [Parasedimentitalea psychrophila]|uniref:Uncharacterized protein n=1 Tax=Parasedimentitalea psychrophila TaxID=2997337 RepID=A0A9Y2P5C9_9RHOB|nr:hypothetical protein [Parasedimentitalea psychrophila]WIY26234.1 hypothetical protein QPJ95_04725 [Parasedimentitalea psychrophila]
MSFARIPLFKRKRPKADVTPSHDEACARDDTDDAFWYAASLARRIANSHPSSSFRELPKEDLHDVGLTRDDNPELRLVMRDAVYFANEHMLKHSRRELIKEVSAATKSAVHFKLGNDPDAGSVTSEKFTKNFEDPASTLWRDQSCKTLVLIKPNTNPAAVGEAFVWAISLHDYVDENGRSRAQKLEEFGLAASFSDTENSSVSNSSLQAEGRSYHGEKMLAGRMTKEGGRDHSDISMKAAAFGDHSGYYRSIPSLPSLFVWVEHQYVAA